MEPAPVPLGPAFSVCWQQRKELWLRSLPPHKPEWEDDERAKKVVNVNTDIQTASNHKKHTNNKLPISGQSTLF